ncbi:predicted protein [Coccidioides posadasii str. Silveira]|uniref:Predicted protein n=1 Tax=Coccidioides posadasii (strain RMSCC 757 / Silveira) TaxID=443226 RepID=E9CZ37_COCPS|nr:predicted protein [Coccidioides posadasii str. Silveira]
MAAEVGIVAVEGHVQNNRSPIWDSSLRGVTAAERAHQMLRKAHTVVIWVHKYGFVHAIIVELNNSGNTPIEPTDVTHKARWCLGPRDVVTLFTLQDPLNTSRFRNCGMTLSGPELEIESA